MYKKSYTTWINGIANRSAAYHGVIIGEGFKSKLVMISSLIRNW